MRDVVDAICGSLKKAQQEVEKRALGPLVERVCAPKGPTVLPSERANLCKKAIERACKVINKLDKRVCTWLKEAACFVSELDVFCTPNQKASKKRARALEALRRERRRPLLYDKVPGGSMRVFGRDGLNRATRARAEATGRAVRYRTRFQNEGRVNSKDVPGWKPPCTDRGHLIGRIVGGTPDPRNVVALPPEFNRGVMARIEKEVAAEARRGRKMLVEVIPSYRGSDPVPVSIRYRVVTTGGRALGKYEFDRRLTVPRPTC